MSNHTEKGLFNKLIIFWERRHGGISPRLPGMIPVCLGWTPFVNMFFAYVISFKGNT